MSTATTPTTTTTSAATSAAAAAPMMTRCKHSAIVTGEYLSETQYYRVIDKQAQGVDVMNARGYQFHIATPILEEGCLAAGQFSKEVKISKTECIKKMLDAKGDIFTVNFNKQPSAESHGLVLGKATISDLTDPAKLKKLSKELEKGEERTLVGHLVDAEPLLGRSKVIDLEEHFKNIDRKRKREPEIHSLKQVDHRHINWLILNGVKYIVK